MSARDGGVRRAAVLAAWLGSRLLRRRLTTRARLESWQRRRLGETLARARAAFPYYRDLPPGGLEVFPVLDKADWLAGFEGLNRYGLGLEECRREAAAAEAARDFSRLRKDLAVGLSSGTSGRQGVFLVSPHERARWAGILLAKALPEALRRGARIALFLRAGSPLYSTLSGGRIRFGYFDLRRPLAELWPAVEGFAPTVLAAPPQVLCLLAAALGEGRLRLSPGRVFSVAEVLDPHDEALVSAAFGRPVEQIYQAAEGFLGLTCATGRIHLNEDLLVIEKEYVDRASGRFVPVVTDLYRETQAVVRYRMGDVLVEAQEPCPCGSPFLAIGRIEGRFDDLLALRPASGEGLAPLFADYVTRAVLGASPAIGDFRCLQEATDSLSLDLAVAAGTDAGEAFAAAREALLSLCADRGLAAPTVRPGAIASRLPEGEPAIKLRRVRRAFPVAPGELLPTG